MVLEVRWQAPRLFRTRTTMSCLHRILVFPVTVLVCLCCVNTPPQISLICRNSLFAELWSIGICIPYVICPVEPHNHTENNYIRLMYLSRKTNKCPTCKKVDLCALRLLLEELGFFLKTLTWHDWRISVSTGNLLNQTKIVFFNVFQAHAHFLLVWKTAYPSISQ